MGGGEPPSWSFKASALSLQVPTSVPPGYVPPYSANSKYYTFNDQDRGSGGGDRTSARNPVLTHLDQAMMTHGHGVAAAPVGGTGDLAMMPARIDNPYRQQGGSM